MFNGLDFKYKKEIKKIFIEFILNLKFEKN